MRNRATIAARRNPDLILAGTTHLATLRIGPIAASSSAAPSPGIAAGPSPA
jgi:hypothetical protein